MPKLFGTDPANIIVAKGLKPEFITMFATDACAPKAAVGFPKLLGFGFIPDKFELVRFKLPAVSEFPDCSTPNT